MRRFDLLHAIDGALDEAVMAGRLRLSTPDPLPPLLREHLRTRAPLHVPPHEPEGVQTVVLVMDRDTCRDLARACFQKDVDCGTSLVTYTGVPIKVDERAEGRIYLVSLKGMTG